MNKTLITRVLAMILALLSVFSLAACSGKSSSTGTAEATATPTPEFVYQAKFSELFGSGDTGINPLAMSDSGVYYSYSEKVGENNPDGLTATYEGQYDIIEYRLAFKGFDGTEAKLENYVPMQSDIDSTDKRDFTSTAYPEQAQITGDGKLAVLETVFSSWSEAPSEVKTSDADYYNYSKSESHYYVRILDTDGTELSNVPLDIDSQSYILGFSVDNDGNIYVGTESTVSVYKADGEKLTDIEADSYLMSFVKERDGGASVLTYGNNGYAVRRVDLSKKCLSEKEYDIPDSVYELKAGSGDYDVYFTAGNDFYGYSFENEKYTKLLNWIDCDVNVDNLSFISASDDGVLRAIEREINSNGDIISLSLVELTKVPYSSVEQKEHLTLATVYGTSDLRNAVISFNRSSDKYHVDIKDYYEMTGSNDYDAAMTKFSTEIMAGNLPDMIEIVNDIPYNQLASKGIIVDLYPYIDADPELSRDDFFPNLIAAYEVDGKLCAAVSSFGILTVAGASSVVGDNPGWTYDDYYAALASMPEGCDGFDYYFTRETMLKLGLALDLNEYMSWSSGKCDFESDAFKEMLEFANQFPSDDEISKHEATSDDNSSVRIAEGKQMLAYTMVYGFTEMSNDNLFGTNTTYIGFPTATGEPGNVFIGTSCVAMTSSCSDPDGAWSFLRTYLSEEMQEKNTNYFPSNINAFNKLLKDAMVIEYEKDANGNILLDENGEKKRKVVGQMYDGVSITDIYSGLSEERAELIKQLINNTTKMYNVDDSIYSIVNEQAQAYFSGQKTVDEVARLIQSKAGIYVNEQK